MNELNVLQFVAIAGLMFLAGYFRSRAFNAERKVVIYEAYFEDRIEWKESKSGIDRAKSEHGRGTPGGGLPLP